MNISGMTDIALRAGKAVLEIYNSSEGMVIERKADNSPLTIADRESHRIIAEALKETGEGLPVLSEEGKSIPFEVRRRWRRYWLVDPLDGTKEFISRNGEFTINIALMEENRPVAGVVYAPAIDLLYYADEGGGAFRKTGREPAVPIHVDREARNGLVAAQSRSHASPEEAEFLAARKVVSTIQIGSSLKFCLIAEGKAHLYPRFGPMMEWDTAAGHAVVVRAGGVVTTWKANEVPYNTESLKHQEGLIVSSGAGS